MLAIAHTIISIPFGLYLENPLIIFTSAFIWHLFCDTLLHWNIYPDNFKKFPTILVALDVISGLIVAWLLINQTLFAIPVLIAIAGGNAPDVLQGIWDVFLNKKQKEKLASIAPFFHFHDSLQLETNSIKLGIISQLALGAIATFLTFIH